MLKIPDNLLDRHAGMLVLELVDQAGAVARQTEVARNLIWAHLDMLMETLWRKNSASISIRESPPLNWKVNDGGYRYVGVVNDEALYGLTATQPQRDTTIVVPCGTALVLRQALHYQGCKSMTVMAINELISFRHCMSRLDTGWGSTKTLIRLLQLYNRRASASDSPDALLIDLPDVPA